jgi:uncharacterized protein with PQ loop repeat
MSPLIDAVGYVGAAIGAGAAVPQVVRGFRVGVAGVSATTYQMAFASGTMWICYGFALGVWPQIPGNTVGGACCLLILWQCWRAGQSLQSVSAVAAITLTISLIVAVVGGPTFLGWFAGLLSCSMRMPQLRSAIVSSDIYGISSLSWGVTIGSNLCWFTYAAAYRDPRILVAATVNMSVSFAIVQIVAVRRRRRSVAAVA